MEPATRGFWRVLESPLVSSLVQESVFDFYARLLSPRLTAKRVMAQVHAVRTEAASVKSVVLRPNGHFRGFRPGQHLNVTVEIDGVRHTRCYSPSNAPDESGEVVLTVKRDPQGLVSPWFHDRLQVGDVVELGQAFGDFTLGSEDPEKLLFIAGGSGITPIASMVRDLCARGRAVDVVVLTYDRSYAEAIFAEDLRALALEHPGLSVFFAMTREAPATGDLAGRFSPAHVARVAPDFNDRRTFVCGPPSLIESVRAFWTERQAPSILLKTETFFPLQTATVSGDDAATVRVSTTRTARSFSANTGSSLLVQAERAGLSPPSGCRQGICFSCTCRKRSGMVRNVSTGATSSEPDEDIRLCVSVPLSDVTLDL